MPRLTRAKLCTWFDAYARALVLFARQCLPMELRWAAEDVTQELFVRLLAKTAEASAMQEPVNPLAWLHRCVRNACQDERRSRVRREHRERAISSARLDWFEPRPDDLIDAAVAQEILETLPDLPRQVVVLRIWSGLTLSEVSDVTGLPVSTAHDHYRNSLWAIRQAMERRSRHATTEPRP